MSTALLDREEYIEQAYFFRTYRERIDENLPTQEILSSLYEEVLATTKLPLAIEFLRGEILLTGRMSDGMSRLSHYFTPFQSFVLSKAEEDKARFDQKIALQVLEREAEYRAESPTVAGLFVYQFECIARNKLGYDKGMTAIAEDPSFDESWRNWILKIRLQLGTIDFADLIYYRSEYFLQERERRDKQTRPDSSYPILFGLQEGRIAKANRGKDPLYMFAALQRQLGYPSVPRARPKSDKPILHPALESRLQRLENRLQLLEQENKEGLDLRDFYVPPPGTPGSQADDDENTFA